MPYNCCVPGCRSNYDPKQPVTIFSFPKDSTRAQTWLRAIHRSDYKVNKSSRVCIKHFDERYIVREDSVTRPDGSVLTVKRDQLKLSNDAIPTLFENLPTYLSKVLPQDRKDPKQRQKEIEKRIEDTKNKQELLDKINSYEEITSKFAVKCASELKNVYYKVSNNQLCFFTVTLTEKQFPKSDLSLVIRTDLTFVVVKDRCV